MNPHQNSPGTRFGDAPWWLHRRVTALAIVAATVVHLTFAHPWFLNWGATASEQAASLPGDELLPDPASTFTRAITIDVPPAGVWPWIVQMGQDRAGFYSNTWLENLAGADIHNANRIHPEWQKRDIGDWVPLARPDLLGGSLASFARTRIVLLESERAIGNIPGPVILQPVGEGRTRVFLREGYPSGPLTRLLSAVTWDPVHFIMQQRMLRGMKERAEGKPLVPSPLVWLARIGWILAGVLVASGLITLRRTWWWLLPPLAAPLPILLATGDGDAALAAFLGLGIPILALRRHPGRSSSPLLLGLIAVAYTLLLAPDPYAALGVELFAISVWYSYQTCFARPHRLKSSRST